MIEGTEIEMIFDDDVQVLVNWIASDPKNNSEKFIKVCGLSNDGELPVSFTLRSYDSYIYFYPPNEEVQHCMCIVGAAYGDPVELFNDWMENDADAPTVFSSKRFVNKLRELNLLNIKSIERSYKLEQII